jgi:hypothetical protein
MIDSKVFCSWLKLSLIIVISDKEMVCEWQ